MFAMLALALCPGCATAPSRSTQFAPNVAGPADDQTTAEIRRHAQEAQDAAAGITFEGSS